MFNDLIPFIEHFTDPVEFERLCCDVLNLLGYSGIDPQGVGRRDAGKDALLHHPQFGRIIFHFSLRADYYRKITDDIERVGRSSLGKFDQFIFFTNRKASAAAKDELKVICKQKLGSFLEVYDQERLRSILETNRPLLARYFPSYFSRIDIVESLHELVNRLSNTLILPSVEQAKSMSDQISSMTLDAASLIGSNKIQDALGAVAKIAEVASNIKESAINGIWILGSLFYQKGYIDRWSSNPKMIETALQAYTYGLQLWPTHYGITFNCAVLKEYNNQGVRYGKGFDGAAALALYTRAATLAVTSDEKADCLDNAGAALLKLGRREEAIQHFRDAQAHCSEHSSSRLNLSITTETSDQQEITCRSLLNSSVGEYARVNLGYLLAKEGRHSEALLTLRPLKGRTRWPLYYAHRGLMSLDRDKVKQAFQFAQRALQDDFEYPQAHEIMGRVLSRLGRFADAAICFETASNTDAEPSVELLLKAASAWHEADPILYAAKIINCLTTALQINPELKLIHNRLGMTYEDIGEIEKARSEYLREAELHPDDAAIPYHNLGHLAEHNANGVQYGPGAAIPDAMKYYEEALRCNPNYAPALFNLGTLLALEENYKKASEYFERALKQEPENDSVIANLAHCFYYTGRRIEAITLWNKAVKINPNNKYARKSLAYAASGLVL